MPAQPHASWATLVLLSSRCQGHGKGEGQGQWAWTGRAAPPWPSRTSVPPLQPPTTCPPRELGRRLTQLCVAAAKAPPGLCPPTASVQPSRRASELSSTFAHLVCLAGEASPGHGTPWSPPYQPPAEWGLGPKNRPLSSPRALRVSPRTARCVSVLFAEMHPTLGKRGSHTSCLCSSMLLTCSCGTWQHGV